MSDLPPTHRRRWRLWMDPGFAVQEWRQLAVLADDLKDIAERLEMLARGMSSGMPWGTRVSDMASRLHRMSYRWGQRAEVAKRDAIKDHKGDFDWIQARETSIREDLAVGAIASARAELETAQKWLGRDSETSERLGQLYAELDRIYAEVYNRDPLRGYG